MGGGLKLRAEDAEDLGVVAAATQDALLRVGDIAVDRKARRVTLMLSRFRWERAADGGLSERVRAALSFEGVLGVKSRKLRTDAPDALAALLSIAFAPDAEPPGGEVLLTLAGGGEISLRVECLDALLMDIGDAWRTPRRPDHES